MGSSVEKLIDQLLSEQSAVIAVLLLVIAGLLRIVAKLWAHIQNQAKTSAELSEKHAAAYLENAKMYAGIKTIIESWRPRR